MPRKQLLGELRDLLTVALLILLVVLSGTIGAHVERDRQRVLFDSLWSVGLPRRIDSIATEAATITTYRFLWVNDSIIRARRRKCGPLLVGC